MNDNYFMIDGSALMAQVRVLWREEAIDKSHKLCPLKMISYFAGHFLRELHGGSFKRAIFYFASGDDATVERHFVLPDYTKPGVIRDISFKFCGQKLKRSADFEEWLPTVPAKFQNRFGKSEKGVDIEICCDAFRLASVGKLQRVFLLTNDDDFVPFCNAIRDFGVNISIIHLFDTGSPNISLLKAADTYDAIPREVLPELFVAPAPAPEPPNEIVEPPSQDKETGAEGDISSFPEQFDDSDADTGKGSEENGQAT